MAQADSTSSPQSCSAPRVGGVGPLQAARQYVSRGWRVIPVPHGHKNPGLDGWQHLRLSEEDLPHRFNGRPQNVGVLLGEPSGWVVDVDLDHERCIALADEYLPATPAVFGRAGRARSHRIYRVTAPVATKKHKSKAAGMLVELRSTGMQTVFPPSTHESGEPIEWELEDAEPAEVDPDELLAAVEALATAVKVELGEKSSLKAKKTARTNDNIRACVAAMLRLKMVDQNDGSSRLFAAACRAVEHDLTDAQAVEAIRQYARQKPFPKDWSDAQILDRVRDAESTTQRGIACLAQDDPRPRVLIDTDEHRVVNESIAALAADEGIFHRGGVLVRVLREEAPDGLIRRKCGCATIGIVPLPNLRERLTRRVQFVQQVRRSNAVVEAPAHPTPWLVGAVDARGEWPQLRALQGLSDAPVLRPDGTLWQTPGYDTATSVLYEPSCRFPPIQEGVGLDDADAAVEELYAVVCNFPFESEDHRSAWLAALLTPLARFGFEGPAPLFLIDANVRGAGKTLLAQTIGHVTLGRDIPASSYAHDAGEMRKKVTAIALAGDRMVQLDNLHGVFGNDVMDRVLTATRWKDRILGKSQEVDLPLNAVWYATGNNVAVAADTTRRIIHIRLDVLAEKPEERSGFRHPDLLAHLRQERPRLLAAALTILLAYCNAGRPKQDLVPFGSYEGWSRLVREAIVWTGRPDPCNTRTRLAEQSDTTTDALAQLLSAWGAMDQHGGGIVVSELLARLYPKDVPPRDEPSVAMRAALENFVGCAPGRAPTARQVGNKLRSFRRRMFRGSYLDSNATENKRNGAVWRLHHA